MPKRILGDKRKRVNVLLNEYERILLKEKMERYGFQNLSDYLRAAGIYENIYVEDLHGKTEVNECVNRLVDKIDRFGLEQEKIMMRTNLSNFDKEQLKKQNQEITDLVAELIRLVNNVLWISVREVCKNPEVYAKQEKLFED